jgi:hypothetical protein
MFHPLGINLAFYTLTLLNGMLSIPIQLAVGLVPASNALLLSSFVLSGFGAYVLAADLLSRAHNTAGRDDTVSPEGKELLTLWLPAFFAGLVYAYSSSKLFYASLGQFNVASSQWIPFALLYALRAGRDRKARSALMAGLFLVLQAYAEITFATFLAMFVALYALYELLRSAVTRGTVQAGLRLRPQQLLRSFSSMALVFLLGLLPMLANMVPDLLLEGDFFASGGGFADVFSANVAGFLLPTQLHPLSGGLTERLAFPHDKGQHIYLGYSVMALTALGIWRWRRSPSVRLWAGAALLSFLLALGPTVRIGALDTGIPGPFALVSQLPFLKGNRYPSRYSVILVLSCAILSAYGCASLARLRGTERARQGTSRRWEFLILISGLSGLVLLEHVSIPLPLTDMRIPSVYDQVASNGGETAVMELPVGWRNGARVLGQQDTVIMFEQWYQTAHHRRLLGGNTSRNPELKFQYFARAPLLSSLVAIQNGHPIPTEIKARDESVAAEVLGLLDVGLVIVHEPPASSGLVSYVEAVMPLERLSQEDGITVYRVTAGLPSVSRIELGTITGPIHLGEGWSPVAGDVDGELAVWAQRREVRLLARLKGDEERVLIRIWSPVDGQSVELWRDGALLGARDLSTGWDTYDIGLAPGAVKPGLNDLRLRFGRLIPLADVGPTHTAGQEVASHRFATSVVVQSAGLEVGGSDLAHIHVNGRDLSPNRRGYNLVALGPDGELLYSGAFDTHLDPIASDQLALAIDGLPAGSLVAAAVADEASRSLTEVAVEALREIGATGDLRDRFRWGHAVIGVKGAEAGQAIESLGFLRPSTAYVGIGATAPRVAAAVAWLEFGALL